MAKKTPSSNLLHIRVGKELKEKMDDLIERGVFSNQAEIAREAIRHLLLKYDSESKYESKEQITEHSKENSKEQTKEKTTEQTKEQIKKEGNKDSKNE
ncbi:ribbon-helix-helix domain-containing protein [Nanoarchaeota archaeon]